MSFCLQSRFKSFYRRNPKLPYNGYIDDEIEVLLAMGNDCKDASRKSTPMVSDVVTLMKATDFKFHIANAYDKRRVKRLWGKCFSIWRIYTARLFGVREKMCQTLVFLRFQRRFNAFRMICREEKSVRLMVCWRESYVEKCWRKNILHNFTRWKYCTRWSRLKFNYTSRVLSILKAYVRLAKKYRSAWHRFVVVSFRRQAILLIQKNFKLHITRKIFRAKKTIKHFLMRLFGLRVFQSRRRAERRRKRFEDETFHIIFEKASVNLDDILKTRKTHQELLASYLRTIRGAMSRSGDNSELPVFPSNKELPDLAKCWTVDGKAHCVVRSRLRRDLRALSDKRYRKDSPPLFECPGCGHVSLVSRLRLVHMRQCPEHLRLLSGEDFNDLRGSVSWRCAGALVEAAIGPFMKFLLPPALQSQPASVPRQISK